MNIGIIAEDESDVAVMRALANKMLKPARVGIKRHVGHGCGRLRHHCSAWATDLMARGCEWIAVVHDLDDNDEVTLRAELERSIEDVPVKEKVVILPRRELEAWLLFDAAAIASAFHETRKPALPANPENLLDPKKHLRDLVRKLYDKVYINTIHNERIALHVSISALARSRSFAPYPKFVEEVKKDWRVRKRKGA